PRAVVPRRPGRLRGGAGVRAGAAHGVLARGRRARGRPAAQPPRLLHRPDGLPAGLPAPDHGGAGCRGVARRDDARHGPGPRDPDRSGPLPRHQPQADDAQRPARPAGAHRPVVGL
ncbi:MAG: hypothetical protein AVDCRST_MAG16-1030, partial [uncultured Frankineae bacterium]